MPDFIKDSKMKVINETKILFTSIPANERFARNTVCTFLMPLDPTIGELSDIRTAVSEAVTNCVVHAYKNKVGVVELIVKIYDNRNVYIRIKDRGCGIPIVEKAMEPLYTTAESDERSGLGFSVMQEFMDKIQVKSEVSKGTVLIMQKKLG
jgi:stage II sporulation protein AB (anti-sigma F factor)